MKHWKHTAALSALLMAAVAVPATAADLDAPVDAVPIKEPAGNFMNLTGPVEWVDLEGGFWAVGGVRLIGNFNFAQYQGRNVVVEGTEFTGVSFQMVPAIVVTSILPAPEVELRSPVPANAPLPRAILVDGNPVDASQGDPVVTADGVLMVPVRSIVEAAGGTVTWINDTQEVRVRMPDRTAVFQIGSQEAEMNEDGVYYLIRNMISTAAAPQLVNGRTLISADAITSILGLYQVKAEEGVLSLVSGKTADLTPPDAAVENLVVGTIEVVEEGRILLKGQPMANGEPMRIWLTVSDETQITVNGNPGTWADLAPGAQVVAELTGPILESYPARGGAASIQVIVDESETFSGVIEAVDEGRILVAGAPMPGGEPPRVYFSITDETVIVMAADGQDQPATAADLAVGQQVEVEHAGPMVLSYPAQAGADLIRILK